MTALIRTFEYGADDTLFSEEDLERIKVATLAIAMSMKQLSGPVTLAVLAGVVLSAMIDFQDPPSAWAGVKRRIDKRLPDAVRDSCEGRA